MSKTGVKLSIDVTKINKDLLHKGLKGTYLNCTVFIVDEPDQYGNNGMITQEVSKEAREAGQQGPILGNCKVFWGGNSAPKNAPQPQSDNFEDNLPF
tara:strand:- start:278 stop:568 length:291 start_codon:yes stop_codon:yes gene_type:complete